MPNVIADLRQRQRALRDEATALLAAADAASSGVLSEEQSARLEAIKAESAETDQKIDAAVAALDTAPDPAAEFTRGVEQGRAEAHAAVVAVLEHCAVADAKASVILGYVKGKTSAEDVRKSLIEGRVAPDEIRGRNPGQSGSPSADADWDEVAGKVNRSFGLK